MWNWEWGVRSFSRDTPLSAPALRRASRVGGRYWAGVRILAHSATGAVVTERQGAAGHCLLRGGGERFDLRGALFGVWLTGWLQAAAH